MNLATIIVQWTGPYSLDEIDKSGKKNGIYLLVGKRKYQRRDEIQYCGITEGYFYDRITAKHHKLSQVRKDTLSIWLGEVVYPLKFRRWHLEVAEHSFIYFWETPLNERKRIYCPNSPVCFISQWFTCNDEPRLNRPPIMKGKSDILWWDEERWRTGRLKVWPKDE